MLFRPPLINEPIEPDGVDLLQAVFDAYCEQHAIDHESGDAAEVARHLVFAFQSGNRDYRSLEDALRWQGMQNVIPFRR